MLALILREPCIDPRVLRVRAECFVDELRVVSIFSYEKGNRPIGLFRERDCTSYDSTLVASPRHDEYIIP